jgi:hypothetical protein
MVTRKIINKKGVLTRDLVIGAVLFSAIVAFCVLAIAGISDEYDSTLLVDEEFSENYDKLSDFTSGIETIRAAAADTGGLSFIGTFDVAFQSTFTVIQMVFSTLDLFGGMSDNFAEDFGLDSTVVALAFIVGLSILTAIIVFLWISSISRGKL